MHAAVGEEKVANAIVDLGGMAQGEFRGDHQPARVHRNPIRRQVAIPGEDGLRLAGSGIQAEEVAQVLVIVLCYYLIAKPFSNRSWYKTKLVNPISLIIAGIALFWSVERFLTTY